MAELPWVHAYAMEDLPAGRCTPWVIFRSEWALAAAVGLLETFRTRRVLWRSPPRYLAWIRFVRPSNFCVNGAGPDVEATAILGALLDLADQLSDTKAFRQRVRARHTERRDREDWVWVALEVSDDGTRAKVAKDLHPFNLPYTADILEVRGYGPACWGWAVAVVAARSPRYPGGGTELSDSSVVMGAAGSSPQGPSPPVASAAPFVGSSGGSLIVSLEPVKHHDTPDVAVDRHDHIPSDRVPQG